MTPRPGTLEEYSDNESRISFAHQDSCREPCARKERSARRERVEKMLNLRTVIVSAWIARKTRIAAPAVVTLKSIEIP
jgi:hypothetical protein